MSDFQSFLFQSMHLIGLKDDTTTNTANVESINELVPKSITKRKLNTIEEPVLSENRKPVSKNASKSESSRYVQVIKKESPAAAAAKIVYKSVKAKDEPEEAIVTKRTDIQSQLQQTSMGNISICTTETFISTNSNSTNATTSTNVHLNDEQPSVAISQKYTTIVESDSNFNYNANDTFPEPPKFESEINDSNLKETASGSVDTQSSDSIVCCVNNNNEIIDYNDNKKVNEKACIENKDVMFDICSMTSSINCLDNRGSSFKTTIQTTNSFVSKTTTNENFQFSNITSVPVDQTTIITNTNINDESFIDNERYNNNMSNAAVIIPNSMNTSVYDCEREVKSPKPVAESISQRILKKISNGDFSPLKSIFNRHYHNKQHSGSNNNSASVSTNEISSTSRSSEKLKESKAPPCIDAKSMESYLAKFEEEILRKAKTEILNECKLLNLKQQSEQQRANNEAEFLKKFLGGMNNTNIELLNTDIDSLEKYNSLLTRIRLNTSKRYNTLPLLYNYFNEKVDAAQITKLMKTIEKASLNGGVDVTEKEAMPAKVSSKQYLINKKRELMDKVAKKMHHKKTTLQRTTIEPQMYANIDLTESLPEIKKNRKKKSEKKETRSTETLSEIINDGFYINEKSHRVEEVKKKQRTRSEVPSVEDNNSLVREQMNTTTLSDQLEEVADRKRHNNDDDDDVDELNDSKIQKVNIRRRKPTLSQTFMNNDHFYNEINEVELKNTVRLKEQRKEDFDKKPAKLTVKPGSNGVVARQENKMNTKPKTSSSTNLTATTRSGSPIKKLPPIANGAVVNPVKKTTAAEHAKNFLRKPSHLLAKLKSPERKILYNDWFAIIKKMDSDPKFDLETLVRTRGRFTEHDRISYRDRLQEQKLRSAKSEPNFGAMRYLSQQNSEQSSEDSMGGNGTRRPKTHSKPPHHGNHNRERSRAHRTVHLGPTKTTDVMMKSESYCENVGRKSWEMQNGEDGEQINNKTNSLSNKLKLTLQKSDVELIKDILKKKNKNITTAELNAMTINALRGKINSEQDLNRSIKKKKKF